MKRKKGKRGLASMTDEQRRRIASMGGKAAQAMGKSHVFTREEARAAGRKGGLTPHKKYVHTFRILSRVPPRTV